jgi:hypothetical protein
MCSSQCVGQGLVRQLRLLQNQSKKYWTVSLGVALIFVGAGSKVDVFSAEFHLEKFLSESIRTKQIRRASWRRKYRV